MPARPAFKMAALKSTRVLIVDKPDLTQTTILLGHRGLRHADPMWFPATLMNYVLGGSDFSSRLMTEVRSKRGPHLRHRLVLRRVALRRRLPRVGLDEERERLAGARRDRRPDPQDEERGPHGRRARQGQGLLRGQLSLRAADGGGRRGRRRGRRAARPRPRLRAEVRAAHGGRRRGAGQGGRRRRCSIPTTCSSSSSARATSSSRRSRPRACATSASTSRTPSAAPRAPSSTSSRADGPSGDLRRACCGRGRPRSAHADAEKREGVARDHVGDEVLLRRQRRQREQRRHDERDAPEPGRSRMSKSESIVVCATCSDGKTLPGGSTRWTHAMKVSDGPE